MAHVRTQLNYLGFLGFNERSLIAQLFPARAVVISGSGGRYGGAMAPGRSPTLHRQLGLTDEEERAIRAELGRPPNHLELAMYAVMWSEHCSYKSSRIHLSRLPSAGSRVLAGPGENAGVVDVGDGLAVAVRIESHNHPSAVEPHQGAATGVGGIIRDVLAVGARPIALFDSLRFGPLSASRSRWHLDGVVGGISAYGNSVGVPTVGGEVVFDPRYSDNPLVNVAALGVLPVDRLTLARASGPGNLAVLLGGRTGRDGIGGVSLLASAGLDEASAAMRPSVQVGDPYCEKRLIEACLELFERGLVVAVQDLGGGGLTCAASETAARGGVGIDVDVEAVPRREPAMEPFEVMTSESQERMLAIVEPKRWEEVAEVCRRWDLEATVVGRVTEGDRLRVREGPSGPVLADVRAASLADEAPRYDRPRTAPQKGPPVGDDARLLVPPEDCGADLCRLLSEPFWLYRQYDHQLFLNTVEPPGADAAVLLLSAPGVRANPSGDGTGPSGARAVAVSTDGNGRWCALDPRRGAAMAVAESALNVACAGAAPLALVDCLNLGNPEHPAVMWELAEVIEGIAEACRVLGIPVVGGNVSLYNETESRDIPPTPVVAVVGLIEALQRRPPGLSLVEGAEVALLGAPTEPVLGGSQWAAEVRGYSGGPLPALDLDLHRRLVELTHRLVARPGLVLGIHDVSDGGLGVALAELCAASGVGLVARGVGGHAELFSESPSRVVVCTADLGAVAALAETAGVSWASLGRAGGERLVVAGTVDVSLERLVAAWRGAIPAAMAGPRG
jgi:phosphoribosylformylglycinamidine synthase II